MGWSVGLFGGRNPRLHTTFSPRPTDATRSGSRPTWSRAGAAAQRQQSEPESGTSSSSRAGAGLEGHPTDRSSRDLYGPKDPAERVRQRLSHVDNAAVVRRAPGKAFVLYSATDRGNELRIVTVDAKTGRPLATSKNLADSVMRTAVAAQTRRGALQPNNVVLGPLSRGGRSVEVTIYSPLNSGGSPRSPAPTARRPRTRAASPPASVRQVAFRNIVQ
jgi:hypothetical protein